MTAYRNQRIAIMGVPFDGGASQRGPAAGPAALRRAGIAEPLLRAGYRVEDYGNLTAAPVSGLNADNPRVRNLSETAEWVRRLMPAAEDLLRNRVLPIWLGGDHSLSLGTVAGAAAYAQSAGRPLYVLWLDAHPDFNTLETTASGNLHGVPVAFFCGLPGFDALLGRPLDAHVRPWNVCMLGIRSVDPLEADLLREHNVRLHDMHAIAKYGISRLLQPFLDEIAAEHGLLHVSFDVDFLDPEIAPGVGTRVPGGATARDAQRVMEMLHGSGLVTSLDIVEFNPFLDEGGRTARLMVDLVATLFGDRLAGRSADPRWSPQTLRQAGS
jgi:arginase